MIEAVKQGLALSQSAIKTLEHLGYTYHGGEYWKPPLGKPPEAEKQEPVAVYGYCPECGEKGVARERRPNGNDCCVNGHTYPSRTALLAPQRQKQETTNEALHK